LVSGPITIRTNGDGRTGLGLTGDGRTGPWLTGPWLTGPWLTGLGLTGLWLLDSAMAMLSKSAVIAFSLALQA